MSTAFENYQRGGPSNETTSDVVDVAVEGLEKTRMITLSAAVKGTEGYIRLFQDFSELATNLSDKSHYVSISASVLDDNPDPEPECRCEKLHYDDQTLNKVYRAIKDVLPHGQLDAHELANAVLLNLQNAGILFRERR